MGMRVDFIMGANGWFQIIYCGMCGIAGRTDRSKYWKPWVACSNCSVRFYTKATTHG